MTRQRDIDRVLDHWLADGVDQMPDRVFDAVLDRIERVPQRRIARLMLRFSEMTATTRLAAAAALVVVAGIGFAAFARSPEDGVGVTPSPTPTASGSEVAGVPDGLRHLYLGPRRDLTEYGITGDRSFIEFHEDRLEYVSGATNAYASRVVTAPPDPTGESTITLRVESLNRVGGCSLDDRGTYELLESPRGNFLTVRAVADDCPGRQAALPGDWLKSECLNPDNACLGVLEPGTYSTQFIDPYLRPGSAPQWEARFGAVTYEVPEGWAASHDFPSTYMLERADGYVARSNDDDETDRIMILARQAPAVPEGEACDLVPAEGVGDSAAELADSMTGKAGLVTERAEPVAIDGAEAFVVDVDFASDLAGPCSELPTGEPFLPLFVENGGPDDGWFLWPIELVGPRDPTRLIFLDLEDGHTVIITVDSADPDNFEEFVSQAMPIVETFNFTPE